MTTLELPALDGRLPLGFLAACGIARLLNEDGDRVGSPIKLSWNDRTGNARLAGVDGLEEVVAALHRVAASVPEHARLPGGPPDFPGAEKPADSPRGDPMRLPVGRFRGQVDEWRHVHGADFIETWIPAMVTDQMADDAGCVSISPFAAPSGQQKFATMFQLVLDMVRSDPELLRQALVAWRRVDGVTGEYLDHHVLQSAADRSDGRSREAGVPGATWLALMALPWFPVVAGRRSPLATGWQTLNRRNYFVWPLWSTGLEPDAIRTLLGHSGLALSAPVGGEGSRSTRGEPLHIDINSLRPLSIFAVGAAERRRISGRNFAGVLTPVDVRTGPRRQAEPRQRVDASVF